MLAVSQLLLLEMMIETIIHQFSCSTEKTILYIPQRINIYDNDAKFSNEDLVENRLSLCRSLAKNYILYKYIYYIIYRQFTEIKSVHPKISMKFFKKSNFIFKIINFSLISEHLENAISFDSAHVIPLPAHFTAGLLFSVLGQLLSMC